MSGYDMITIVLEGLFVPGLPKALAFACMSAGTDELLRKAANPQPPIA